MKKKKRDIMKKITYKGDEMKTRSIKLTVSNEVWKEFKVKCVREEKSLSDEIGVLIVNSLKKEKKEKVPREAKGEKDNT